MQVNPSADTPVCDALSPQSLSPELLFLMTQGYVASFNARTRRGFVRQGRHGDLIPFMVEQSDTMLSPGDFVEFAVTGGKAGLLALNVRPLRQAA